MDHVPSPFWVCHRERGDGVSDLVSQSVEWIGARATKGRWEMRATSLCDKVARGPANGGRL